MKMDQAIEHFVNYIATERRLAANTVEIYSSCLAAFQGFLKERDVDEIGQISSLDIREWQMKLMEEGLAPRSVAQSMAALRSFFKFLRRQKWIDSDLMAKVPTIKFSKKLPVFFRESEAERIYTSKELFPDDFIGRRDRLILQILYETGMRRAELVGLTEGSVDFVGGTVKVLGKRDKERFIPIENELSHNIREYLALKKKIESCDEALFVTEKGKSLSAEAVYHVVKKYMAQLSNADKISPHVFRHSFATHMLNEGADINAIKELLGHADLMATEVYTHVTREHLKEAYKHAHPRARKDDKE